MSATLFPGVTDCPPVPLFVVGSETSQHNPYLLFKRPGKLSPGGKLYLNLFINFGPWLKGEEKGNLKLLTTPTTRASRSEQWAASKSSTNRHHSCASRSEQWAAIGKAEGTELFLHTSKPFFIRKTSISITSKLHKRRSIAENQSFKVWRSTFFGLPKLAKWLSLCFLSVFSFFRQGRKSSICHVHISWTSAKGDGRRPELHLSSLWMSRHLSLLRTSPWYMTQSFSWLGLGPTFPVLWVQMLTTRTPSPWFQCLRSLCIDLHPTSGTSLWKSFSSVHVLHYQFFSSLLHAFSFVSQLESSRLEGPSRQQIRALWRHSWLFPNVLHKTWGLSQYIVSL